MDTIQFKADRKAVDTFIQEIQELFPNYEIHLGNVNDFAVLHEEHMNCAKCNGLAFCKNAEFGHRTEYQDGQFVAVPCKYKKEESTKHNSLIKTLYLPDTILNAKLEDYYTTSDSRCKIYKHIIDFVGNFGEDEFNKGLYLYSSFSMGKTYSLAVIANELAKKNIGCLLIYFPDLVLDLKGAIGTHRFEELINMLKSIDVLMLDDLGAENMTSWVRDEILGPVVNYRVMSKKPLYVSSNINPADLTKYLAMDNNPQSILKAERIVNRMQAVLKSISMDDGQVYKR